MKEGINGLFGDETSGSTPPTLPDLDRRADVEVIDSERSGGALRRHVLQVCFYWLLIG